LFSKFFIVAENESNDDQPDLEWADYFKERTWFIVWRWKWRIIGNAICTRTKE